MIPHKSVFGEEAEHSHGCELEQFWRSDCGQCDEEEEDVASRRFHTHGTPSLSRAKVWSGELRVKSLVDGITCGEQR